MIDPLKEEAEETDISTKACTIMTLVQKYF